MSSLAKHPFSWRYIFLRICAVLLRSIATPTQRLRARKLKIHQGVIFKNITVPSRDKGRHIQVHFYQPASYDPTKPAPVLIHWHGSGFVFPSLGTNREFCSLIAARTRCLVFDADYRKAPEHPFPAALQDAEDIFHFLAARPDQYDVSNIFLGGSSAGGNIALAAASTLGPQRVKGVIAFYPPIDFTDLQSAPKKHLNAGVAIPSFAREFFDCSYILASQDRADPQLSIIFAPVESFPSHVYLVCGKADGLYYSTEKLVERLKGAGHKGVEFVGPADMGHAFDMFDNKCYEAEENKHQAYDGAVNLINRAIGESENQN